MATLAVRPWSGQQTLRPRAPATALRGRLKRSPVSLELLGPGRPQADTLRLPALRPRRPSSLSALLFPESAPRCLGGARCDW